MRIYPLAGGFHTEGVQAEESPVYLLWIGTQPEWTSEVTTIVIRAIGQAHFALGNYCEEDNNFQPEKAFVSGLTQLGFYAWAHGLR